MNARPFVLSSLLCFAACATVPNKVLIAPAFLASEGAVDPDVPIVMPASGRATAPADNFVGKSYTMAKVGIFMPAGDIEDLDDGLSFEGVFGRELLPFLSIEGSIGYLSADGNFGPTQLDLWAVPLFVNGRVSLPILFFEPYAGVGIGGIYADYEAAGLMSDSDFVAAYQAFLGVEFGLGRLAVGAEYRYLKSEDTKDDFALEGGIASLFVSLPF
jgi:opacity protein-like surface antigen